MTSNILNANGIKYRRITKAQAKNAFLQGFKLVLTPINTTNNQMIIKATPGAATINDFRRIVNDFEFNNCIDTKSGLYAAFYVAK